MKKIWLTISRFGQRIKGHIISHKIEIVSALLTILLFYAGFTKLQDRHGFMVQLAFSPWQVLANNATLVSWVVPIGELVVVLFLVVPDWRWIGLYLSLATMLVFTAYLAILIFSGVKLPCSCGGVISHMSWHWHLVMNVAFMALAFLGVRWHRIKDKTGGEKELDFTQLNVG